MTKPLLRALVLFSTATVLSLQPAIAGPSSSSEVTCWMNTVKQNCTITPAPNDGFKIEFSAGDKPFFVFTSAGPATTLNRKMNDAQGRTWIMNGSRSFTLKEMGGYDNVIKVSAP